MPNPSPAVRAAASARRTPTSPRAAPLAALLLAASLLPLAARAQPVAPEDWPCVQVFVPEVSAAAFWPVPIDGALAGSWRDDPETAALARRLGELETLDGTALAAIDAYASAVPETERRAALTRLADGTVAVANERRSRYLDGIRRYTRQQIAIAGQIESTLNRLAALDDADAAGTPQASAPERAAIEETLDWHERLYDQRERSVRALCERPPELEQRLSEVLRELSYRLPES